MTNGDRQLETQPARERETDRQTAKVRNIESERETETMTGRNRQRRRQRYGQSEREIDRQTDRQTEGATVIYQSLSFLTRDRKISADPDEWKIGLLREFKTKAKFYFKQFNLT